MKFAQALKSFSISESLHSSQISKLLDTLGENEDVYCVVAINVLVVPRNSRTFSSGIKKPPIYIDGLFVITENRLIQVGDTLASQIPLSDIVTIDAFDYKRTRVLQICSNSTAFQITAHSSVVENVINYIDKARRDSFRRTPDFNEEGDCFKGDDIISKIKYYCEKIQNENLKEALLQIQKVVTSIYDNKKLHNSNEKSIAKFNSYYIPTLIKLLKNYSDFEEFFDASIKAREICTECEKSIYSIKDAFFRLFDNMFEASMIDISGEISALEATLACDGLLEDDIMKMMRKK